MFRTVLTRVVGVLRRPRSTLTDAATAHGWVGILVATTVAAAAANAIFASTEVGQQALVDQWERTALAFGQAVDDTRYAQFREWSAQGPAYGLFSAVLNVPVLTGAVAVLIQAAFGRRGVRVPFTAVMAVAAHAGVILALRAIVAAPVAYARETTASTTSLGAWFPGLDEASPVARLLGLIDLFAIWWAVVLAIGVSVLYRRRTSRVAAAFVGVYAGVALVLVLAMAALGMS